MDEREMPGDASSGVPAEPDGDGLVRCDVTGEMLPADETIVLQGYRVGAAGKQVLLDRISASERLPGELARPGFVRRFLCMFIDGVLVMGLVPTAVMVMTLLAFDLPALAVVDPTTGPRADMSAVIRLWVALSVSTLISTLIAVLYYTLMHARLGQTLGKMVGRIKLVRHDHAGGPVSMTQSFWRAMLWAGIFFVPPVVMLAMLAVVEPLAAYGFYTLVSVAVFMFVLANIIVALCDDQHQRALHDRFTGTRVIMADD